MVGWLKKKLHNWYNKQVAEHIKDGDYRKPHFRKLTVEERAEIQAKISTPIKWERTQGKRGYDIFPGFTIEKVKEATGLKLNYLSGEWYVVEYK